VLASKPSEGSEMENYANEKCISLEYNVEAFNDKLLVLW
jgi:hypothetical protein